MRRPISLIAFVTLAVLGLAGCGGGSAGPGVASGASTTPTPTTSGASQSGSAYDQALNFARCMRSHGITNFPDPSGSGDFSIGPGVDQSSPQFLSAENACKSLRLAGKLSATQGGAQPGGSGYNGPLLYSQCMRAHGEPNFPDPDSSGRVGITKGSGIDPNSPQFKTAENACKSLNPAGSVTPAQQRQFFDQLLRFSQCMRAHGISKFPDPQYNGSGPIGVPFVGGGYGIDPNSPLYQRAVQACRQGTGQQGGSGP